MRENEDERRFMFHVSISRASRHCVVLTGFALVHDGADSLNPLLHIICKAQLRLC